LEKSNPCFIICVAYVNDKGAELLILRFSYTIQLSFSFD